LDMAHSFMEMENAEEEPSLWTSLSRRASEDVVFGYLAMLLSKMPFALDWRLVFWLLIDTSLLFLTSFGCVKLRRFGSLERWICRSRQPCLPLLIIFQLHGLKSREYVSQYH
jgi:hypothetical protein